MDKKNLLDFVQNMIPDLKVTRGGLDAIGENFDEIEFAKNEGNEITREYPGCAPLPGFL